MTKEQQFNQESRRIDNQIDAYNKSKSDLQEEILSLQLQNSILLNALKEIAVPYPETNNSEQDKALCKYLIAKADEAIGKVIPNAHVHPIFQDILNNMK